MVENVELETYPAGKQHNDRSAESSESSDVLHHRKETKNEGIFINQENMSEVESLYGNDDPDVKRDLKPRHMSMISLGGTIGTGLFMGIASPIRVAGPVGSLLAYLFMGTIAFCVTQSLGEMATFIPVTSSFTMYTQRFLSPALGAANGYLYWFSWCVTFALELSIIGQLIQYWTFAVPLSVWIVVFWILLTASNMIPVRFYGEIEFWIAALKVLSIFGFLIYALVMVCGGSSEGALGFRYWKNPGPWGMGMISSNKYEARFLGWVSSLIKAAFTYQGTELVGITAGESKNPRKTVPKAINKVFFRILFFYILSLFFVGLLVPYTDPRLSTTSDSDINTSPFVMAIQNSGTKVLPSVFNGVILVTILSAGNSNIYIGSRVLYGLSKSGLAPSLFKKTNKQGVPFYAVLTSSIFGCLAYLNISQNAKKVFDWLLTITAVAGFFAWLLISLSHIRFMQVLKDRGISRNDLPFKAKFMPWGAYYAAFFITVIILIQGFDSFAPEFVFSEFIADYISVFLFIVCWLGFQVLFKTRLILRKEDVDIDTDRREIDALVWSDDDEPKTLLQKLWQSFS
ncbi:arginine permease ALP1 Ecym_1087 [Eremothecium cymbalariae DBVPG|uniref:Amino acid permease/ SLC12A domain-containing protein n=1 Tax=Eremothecium cymbalariae (strain CBS 270.75 / DBVPG 7215 / KCTC 17166 / NRRL Y-17582) TaxID=931890 RepID=G8JMD5_ERECY|nr:hypothetical protein Ecym_1087 [Eremothecium cymbalariae DBVPG\